MSDDTNNKDDEMLTLEDRECIICNEVKPYVLVVYGRYDVNVCVDCMKDAIEQIEEDKIQNEPVAECPHCQGLVEVVDSRIAEHYPVEITPVKARPHDLLQPTPYLCQGSHLAVNPSKVKTRATWFEDKEK